MTAVTDRANFVTAAPETYTTSLVRREDVSQAVTQLLAIYDEQQRAMLAGLTPTRPDGLSSNDAAIRERRRTTALYLGYYTLVIAAAIGGILGLVRLAGLVGNGEFFALWIAVTGLLALYLAWLRHGQEIANSPEGIAHHVIDAGENVLLYRAQTERLALEWQSDADNRRLDLAEAQAAQAREAAQLRLAELDRQREAVAAQQARLSATPPPDPAPLAPVDPFAAALVTALAALYDRNPDGSFKRLSAEGMLLETAPWAARGAWTPADRNRAALILAQAPQVIEQRDGGRWWVRLAEFPTAEAAIAAVTRHL